MSIKPLKSLGQNFLTDDNIIRKIVDAIELQKNDTLIEIGPGTGALTKYFVEKDINFLAIEKDTRAYDFLKQKYNNINVINQDILEFDFRRYDKFKVIGNLPYYITSEILHRFFLINDKIHSAVFTIQKEVAQRIVASPNSKIYGVLSIAAQLYTKPKILFNIPPGAFYPPPKVTSSVIHLEFLETPLYDKPEELMKFVKACFSQRRKKISNSLKSYLSSHNMNIEIIKNSLYCDLLNKRAENLSIDDYINLYDLLNN